MSLSWFKGTIMYSRFSSVGPLCFILKRKVQVISFVGAGHVSENPDPRTGTKGSRSLWTEVPRRLYQFQVLPGPQRRLLP